MSKSVRGTKKAKKNPTSQDRTVAYRDPLEQGRERKVAHSWRRVWQANPRAGKPNCKLRDRELYKRLRICRMCMVLFDTQFRLAWETVREEKWGPATRNWSLG